MTQRTGKLLKYFEKGSKALSVADYEGAAAWFAAIVEINPTDKEALLLYEKARIMNAQKGLNALNRILYRILAELMFSFSKKAALHYLGILSMDKPHDPHLAAKYGKALMASGQTALASLAFRRALQFLSTDKAILKSAAVAFEAIDDRPAAIDVYSQLAKLEPTRDEWNAKAKNLSATHYGESGGITNLKDKRSEEEKISLQRQTTEGREERIRDLLDEYKADPEGKKGHLLEIGRLLIQIEKYDQALPIWTRVMDASKTGEGGDLDDRKIEEALHMIALCHEKRGRFDQAEEGYLALVQRFPLDPRYCEALYSLRLHRADLDIEASPEDAGLVEQRAAIQKEHWEKKAAIYEDLVEKRPGDPDIMLSYGKALHEMGRIDEAIPIFQKTSQNPARAYPALRQLAWLFIEKGQHPLAIDTFKRAMEKAPPARTPTGDMKDIWYGLGEAYIRQGDKLNAREWWKNVYECDIEFRDIKQKYEELVT